MQKERIECQITGRVQMVMYRDFTRRKARMLGLCGFVRNNEDGSVAVVAEGPRDTLDVFLLALRKGSLWSRVDYIDTEWKPATGEYTSFQIAY
jgi:acylphosphatase